MQDQLAPQSIISSWYKSIPVKNVYYMLYYALCGLGMRPYNFKDVAEEKFEDVLDLLAAILWKGIGWQRMQGLYREYIERTEDLPTIRGKIDMVGTIRNKIARKRLISCEYDELSENTLGNQILKTTAMLLLREKSVKKERKDALRREMLYFSNVEEIRTLTSIPWSRLRFHRNNQVYQTLIYICQLVLDRLLLTTADGKHRLKSFFDEDHMAWLYEKFILGYYEEEFQEKRKKLGVNAKRIEWALDEEDTYEKLPKMQSDITLSYPDADDPSKVLIIDAKWYKKVLQPQKTVRKSQDNDKDQEDAGDDQVDADENYKDNRDRIRSANLYQIFTYVKNKEANLGKGSHTVSGMLLYARTFKKGEGGELGAPLTTGPDEDPNNVGGPYKMSGNKIYVKTLDLTKDFEGELGIRSQLNMIVRDVFGRKIF